MASKLTESTGGWGVGGEKEREREREREREGGREGGKETLFKHGNSINTKLL